MALHEWRVSLLDGKRTLRISRDGLQISGKHFPWKDLTEVAFARYATRGGRHEELSLWFGPDNKQKLRWIGTYRRRDSWRAMLLDFAHEVQMRRPDLRLRDGPDAAEKSVARWIGLGIAALALTIMIGIFLARPGPMGGLAALWIGVVGTVVGGVTYGHYRGQEAPPEIDWSSFAEREAQSGDLPAH